MITWAETIDIIKETFEIKQKDLAKHLNISESELSRVRNGTIKLPLDYESVFDKIFNPDTLESPAQRKRETKAGLLIILKKIIENNYGDVQKALVDYNCWEITDYKSFVLEWLRRTRKPIAAKKCDNTEDLKSATEAPNEQMVRIFEQSISEYHIAKYIYNLPDYLTDGFPQVDQCLDMEHFIKTIQENVLGKFFTQQNEDVFINIREFNHMLKSYNGLCCHFLGHALYDYGIIWAPNMNIADDAIIAAIDDECAEIEKDLHQNGPEGRSEIDKELFQLKATREIVVLRKQLCGLFEEICPGKCLLIF